MNDMEQSENPETEKLSSHYAMLVALKTMNERCRQLETRLATVEEENKFLRLECGKDESAAIVKAKHDNEGTILETLREKVEDLSMQKSQLNHQIFMVAAENRQLWKRLTKLTRINKSLGSQLTKISDTLKQHSPAKPSDYESYKFCNVSQCIQQKDQPLITDNGEREQSLEEISLRLINSIMLEKSDLEQQYAEIAALQNNTEGNLQKIGFTYPENSDTDLEILKQHDTKLIQIKNTLLSQQTKLKRALRYFQKMKEGAMCNNCRMNASKKMCQAGTQFDSDESFKEHGATQTSLQTSSLPLEKCSNSADSPEQDNKICPLCGSFYGKVIPFEVFHEHVLSHFNEDMSIDGVEIVH
ncbi:C2H2-type zinc binding domain-containing protein spindle-F isoform X2 [Megalopta genalis]|uniref:C2H2-type zinc binding domain-containing protein spindle-F isoform X2 n=1 Tax=Megalopta genalis TaxID=115081 RepID=UPI001443736E|nr:protein spindle-F isoform X2 [Megalopta genalis]